MGQKASTIVVDEITARYSFTPLLITNPIPLTVDDSYVWLT